jgi:hypothetical protein
MERGMSTNGSKLILIGIVLVLAGLSGCATMSGDECITSDWTTIGYEDGVRGYTADRIGKHRKACAKHGVTPDFSAYQSGREQGLVEYCQPSRGFSVGSSGGRYNGVCSVNQEADFLDAYNAGYHLYTLRSNVNRENSAINSKEHELERIDASIHEKELVLISDGATTEERIVLLLDLKELAERTGRLEAEIRQHYEDRARYQVELDHYRVTVADFGY